MAEPLMTITVDTRDLFAAMDAMPNVIMAALKANAKVTADNIAREAKARIARATGATAEAITVEETHNGDGYVVFVGNERTYIGRFLEFGTKFMAARPFLFTSARIEEGSHDRRALEAVQAAIDSKGLGD
jgi:HK97 gp10 family phage protein